MSSTSLLTELRGHRQLREIVTDLAIGHLETPGSSEQSLRWAWLADVLAHPAWGVAAVVDDVDDVCQPVAQVCRVTACADARQLPDLRELWFVQHLRATEAITKPFALESSGRWDALNAAIEVITDGLDYCTGRDTSGTEAVVSAFSAALAVQDRNTARATITAAVESWQSLAVIHRRASTQNSPPSLETGLGAAS
jgi:hypothetical protein